MSSKINHKNIHVIKMADTLKNIIFLFHMKTIIKFVSKVSKKVFIET